MLGARGAVGSLVLREEGMAPSGSLEVEEYRQNIRAKMNQQ